MAKKIKYNKGGHTSVPKKKSTRVQPTRPHVKVPGPGGEFGGLNLPYEVDPGNGPRIQRPKRKPKRKPEKKTPQRKIPK